MPQAQTVRASAFFDCVLLASVYFDNDAPAIGTSIFGEIPPNQVTVYVTNPQATGWGEKLGGMPVVRLPLYASNVTAQAYTLNGDTITEWPSAITKGIYSSVDIYNVIPDMTTTVTLVEGKATYDINVYTNTVIAFDSDALDFTDKEAEFKLVLNITETNIPTIGLRAGIEYARTPEYTVTGRYENIVTTLDGTNFLIRQTFPTIYEKEGWPGTSSDHALPAWPNANDPFYSYIQAPANSAKSCSLTLIKPQEGLVKVSRLS